MNAHLVGIGCFFLLVTSVWASEPDPRKSPRLQTMAQCQTFYAAKNLLKGVDPSAADKALRGSRSAADAIVTSILSASGDGPSDIPTACRLQFWLDLSAQNGNLQAHYELALGDWRQDAISCRRSKSHAAIVIGRLEEFRRSSTGPASQVESQLKFRARQMREVLDKSCRPLAQANDQKP